MRSLAAAAVCISLLAAAPWAAAETWLSFALASYHFDRSKDYNERNWGIGIERPLTPDIRLAAGEYKNSHSDTSVYAGAIYAPLHYGILHGGLLAGAVTGYERTVTVGLAPIAILERGGVGLNLVYMPAHGDNPAVLGLQVKFRI